MTLNTEMTLRKQTKAEKKQDRREVGLPQNKPLPLLISTRDTQLTFCRGRDITGQSPSSHPTDNTERVHTQLDDGEIRQHYYSHMHTTAYEGVLECICVVWMSWTDLSVA